MAFQWRRLLDALIIIFHLITDSIFEFILGWYWGEKKQCTAPTNDQLKILKKSAVELAKLIRERKLTSYEVVKAYQQHIKSINPQINAVVDGPFLEALDEAKSVDESLDNNQLSESELSLKPFLGVPFTTKDSTAVAGKLHTLGIQSRRNTRATEDAEHIRLMKESGAIIIATSNIPEICKWIESRNLIIGQTNNPYDLRRSVGGSSGGEAALVSSCATAFGVGTDIGGSIRIPCFNCGIFGHKTTAQVVNMRGCTFRTGKEISMVVAGPMTRHADDLLPILRIIVGPDMSERLKLQEPVDVKKLKYFYIPTNNMPQCNPINHQTQNVMLKIQDHFSKLTGEDVKLAKLPYTELSGRMWRYWMTQEPANFNKLLGNGKEVNPFVELFKKLLGQSDYTLAAIYGLIDSVLPAENAELIREATNVCKSALNKLLGDDGVLFYHSSPRTAPFHYYPLLKFLDFAYFNLFNVLRVPATQVPMGLDKNGLPLGIQVVATEMNDRLCLAVAKELERAFGGWVSPFSTN